jgi:NAD(P)-dependent dehydrogenase (short-subunit alcohol dehydrogenase family)
MDISGKVAIVTGAASGLGLATVRKLALEGAKAVILDLPSSEGKKVAEELGAGTVFVAADVIDPHIVASPMLNGEVIRLDGAIRMAPR